MKEIKKIDSIEHISGFYKGQLILKSCNNKFVLFIAEKSLDILLKLPYINYSYLTIINDVIYLFPKDILIYDDIKKDFILYKESQDDNYTIFNDKYLYGYNYNREDKVLTVTFFNRNSQKIIWQQNYEDRRFPRNCCEHLFLTDINYTYIDNINLETGKSEWMFDFGMKVYGNILEHKNTLIIPLNNNHLLGINAQTGEKLWEMEDCLNYYFLQENTCLFYGYARERFEIIDAVKGEKILRKQLTGSMDKYSISPDQNMCTLAGNSLYFVSNWKGSTKFGKVNIHTQEIEFVQELGVEKGVKANEPVYHNGRLYILDSVGTLHIFEEE
jgi:hypothetical protein